MKPYQILLLILAIVTIVWLTRETISANREATTLRAVNAEKNAKIAAIRTENGRLKYQKLSVEIDRDIAIKNLKEYYAEEVKDIEENHEVKINNLQTYYRAKTQTTGEGSVRIDTVVVDSVGYASVNVDDGWLQLSGRFNERTFDYQYTYTDSVSVVTHYVGRWPKKELHVSFSSANPRTELQSVTTFTIKEKPARWGIGPAVLVGTGGVNVGVSIQYSIWRF